MEVKVNGSVEEGVLGKVVSEVRDACAEYANRVSALKEGSSDRDYADAEEVAARLLSVADELVNKTHNVEHVIRQKQELIDMYRSITLK